MNAFIGFMRNVFSYLIYIFLVVMAIKYLASV